MTPENAASTVNDSHALVGPASAVWFMAASLNRTRTSRGLSGLGLAAAHTGLLPR
jgi:hypothetical protein